MDEKAHASLIVLFYQSLTQAFEQRGIDIFIEATILQANQRGLRMRKRAISQGFNNFDYPTYFSFSEWSITNPPFFSTYEGEKNGDKKTLVFRCPWASTFAAMDSKDCGAIYCQYIDQEILRGFNPDLVLELNGLLHTSKFCDFTWKNALNDKEQSNKMITWAKEHKHLTSLPFSYHVCHIFSTYRETILKHYPNQGQMIVDQVINKFRLLYGAEITSYILSKQSLDYNQPIDPVSWLT